MQNVAEEILEQIGVTLKDFEKCLDVYPQDPTYAPLINVVREDSQVDRQEGVAPDKRVEKKQPTLDKKEALAAQ